MEGVVEIVNQLQDVFSSGVGVVGIDLPQIVVVGTQSAGKSSVLEQIVGKSFLPRGTGIVTRCPLVLQLVHAPNETKEYAVFTHNPDEILTDYDAIRHEIENQTKRVAGANKGICNTRINLKMYSPSLLNLTLVDLPGLTKVPVGDQPQNIEEQTRDLILEYIQNPNSIILAVTAANVDMATSESLKLAKEVDPEGARTLAVLTKLDLMDEGTDAWDMLHGKIIPVKLGIIGVVNRSQKDINDEKTVEDSLKDEADFLKKNYKSISAIHGTPYLRTTVQAILVSHIQKCMPGLKDRISDKLMNRKSELSLYAKSKLNNPTLLLNIITKFNTIYTSAIKGFKTNIQTDDLYGGARIHSVFQDIFSKELRRIDPLVGLTKSDIINAIKNANGTNPAIFVPEDAFELLIRRQLERFRSPSLKCVELVYSELKNIALVCLDDVNLQLDHYPQLKTVLGNVVNDSLQRRMPGTKKNVETFIDTQLAHINTSHPDFLTKQTESLQVMTMDRQSNAYKRPADDLMTFGFVIKKAKTSQSQLCINLPQNFGFGAEDESSRDYVLVMELIKDYFSIECKIVEDQVPKMIFKHLVNSIVDQLQVELMQQVYDKENVEQLLCESKTTVEKRNDLEAEIDTLEKADKIINNISMMMLESTRVLKPQKHF